MERKRCYIVIGPYRSGTSLVSRLLQQFGVSAGPDVSLYEATDWNPAGYIQRPDITDLNTRLITNAGGTLMNPGHPFDICQRTKKSFFSQLDWSWMNNGQSFLIKDPRFCFTFWTWYRHQVLCNYELAIIRVSRNIDATVKSALAHYDVKHYCGNSNESAAHVLAAYNTFAAWHTENINIPFFHINYDELVNNPEKVIVNLAQFLESDDTNMIHGAITATSSGRSKIVGSKLTVFTAQD